MKVHQKDIAQLLKVAERAGKAGDVLLVRKLTPPMVLALATISQDEALADIASKAQGKRNSSIEFLQFIAACTPIKIKTLCRHAIHLNEAQIQQSSANEDQ